MRVRSVLRTRTWRWLRLKALRSASRIWWLLYWHLYLRHRIKVGFTGFKSVTDRSCVSGQVLYSANLNVEMDATEDGVE